MTENPYAAQVNEALALLTKHAGYTGQLDGWFGPMALEALHRLKNTRDDAVQAYYVFKSDHDGLSTRHGAALRDNTQLTAQVANLTANLHAARADLDELRRRPASELVDALAVHVRHMATLLEDRP